MKHLFIALTLAACLLSACGNVNLDAPVPLLESGIDPEAWVTIPAGEFHHGQEGEIEEIAYDYQVMVTDVTVEQYAAFVNKGISNETLNLAGDEITTFYPGDEFRGTRHELEISAGNYAILPTNDPASRFTFAFDKLTAMPGWEKHPMTNVTWFGAWAYCKSISGRLPGELEWEKAARGSQDDRPFPWGEEITLQHANFYASRDPFEDMATFGSRTTPVGFYNGKTYGEYKTMDSASPYGLYDMAGNAWQWVGDITPGFSDRFMHGGSKGTYDMDLRIWVRNSAPPMYFSPSVGFRCARNP